MKPTRATERAIYRDAVKSVKRVLTEVYGKPPKAATVAEVAKGLARSVLAVQPKVRDPISPSA